MDHKGRFAAKRGMQAIVIIELDPRSGACSDLCGSHPPGVGKQIAHLFPINLRRLAFSTCDNARGAFTQSAFPLMDHRCADTPSRFTAVFLWAMP